jgi:hypothetical protein
MGAVIASMTMVLVLAGSPKRADLVVVTQTGTTATSLATSRSTLQCRDHSATGTGFLRTRAKTACDLIRQGGLGRVIEARAKGTRLCSQIYATGGDQRAGGLGADRSPDHSQRRMWRGGLAGTPIVARRPRT